MIGLEREGMGESEGELKRRKRVVNGERKIKRRERGDRVILSGKK